MSRLSNDTAVIAEAAVLLATPIGLPASIAGASVTDPAGATASNPSAPASFTVPLVAQAVAVVSEAATDLDTVAAAVKVLHTEVITYETAISALIVDVASIRTQFSALLTSLEAAGLIAT